MSNTAIDKENWYEIPGKGCKKMTVTRLIRAHLEQSGVEGGLLDKIWKERFVYKRAKRIKNRSTGEGD